MRLVSQTIYINSKQQTTWFSLWSNPTWVKCIFSSLFVSLLCTAGRIFLRCSSALLLQPSWWPPHRQESPIDNLLEFREKKKVSWSEIKGKGRLFQYDDVPLGQELLDAHGVVMVMLPLFGSVCTLSKTCTWGSPCWHADWLTDLVVRNWFGWCSSYQRTWSTWFCLAFFSLGDVGDFRWLFWLLVSRLSSKLQISSPVLTLLSLEMFHDVLIHLLVVLLLIIIQQS